MILGEDCVLRVAHMLLVLRHWQGVYSSAIRGRLKSEFFSMERHSLSPRIFLSPSPSLPISLLTLFISQGSARCVSVISNLIFDCKQTPLGPYSREGGFALGTIRICCSSDSSSCKEHKYMCI